MWSDDEGPFEGKHYRLAETISQPRTIQRPHPPIVIGGSGERKTLRMVAQYADATNLIVPDLETAVHKLAVLREHCDALGRDYDSIEKTVQGSRMNPLDDPDAFLRLAEGFAAAGVEHLHFGLPNPDPVGYIEKFAETVAPGLAAIEVRSRG
jgi:alkanesulfonate monooxygenase SsuD/methylene tetrahydromethanopterin reductase-like flavin-dependent oxidoreductase (luciferase family)